MICLTGLDGRRDGSSSIRQPESKLTRSIHSSRGSKAARRGCFISVDHIMGVYSRVLSAFSNASSNRKIPMCYITTLQRKKQSFLIHCSPSRKTTTVFVIQY